MTNKLVAVAASGGIDSTVLAYSLVREYGSAKVVLLFADVDQAGGQKHYNNLVYHANLLDISLHRIPILYPLLLKKGSPMFGNWGTLTKDEYAKYTSSLRQAVDVAEYNNALVGYGYVPGLYTIILVTLGAVAKGLGCAELAVGYECDTGSSDTSHFFPMDSSPAFLDILNCHSETIFGPGGLSLTMPFVGMSKVDVVRLGFDLGVDFSKTHSCGSYPACEKCHECRKTRESLAFCGVVR